jgi:glyceraldehyde-3-phosphate dehydrogenase/erythrose-4-phosphate dehydrogenase
VAIRPPVTVGSLADIVAVSARSVTVAEIIRIFTEEAESERYRGILGVTDDPIVSSGIIGNLGLTQVVDGDLVQSDELARALRSHQQSVRSTKTQPPRGNAGTRTPVRCHQRY